MNIDKTQQLRDAIHDLAFKRVEIQQAVGKANVVLSYLQGFGKWLNSRSGIHVLSINNW